MKRFFISVLLVCLPVLVGAVVPENGKPLMAGGPDGLAPLQLNRNITGKVMGYARLDGSESVFLFAPSGLDIGMWLCAREDDIDGHAVFSKTARLSNPWDKKPGNARVFQDGDDVYMIRLNKTKLTLAKWDGMSNFEECFNTPLAGLPASVASFSIIRRDKRTLEVAALCPNGEAYRPDYLYKITESLYDGAGTYRGNFPKCGLYRLFLDNDFCQLGVAERVSADDDVLVCGASVAIVGDRGYVVTNPQGAMKFLPYDKKLPKGGESADYLRRADGTVITFPCHGAGVCTVPAADGSLTRLMVGGESAFYTMDLSAQAVAGSAAFDDPVVVLEKNAPLYGGSLTVPNVVDWDGDGVLDIVAGNSEARILFYKNYGTDADPDFRMPVALEAAGQEILLRPGYYVTQGPGEGAWGYVAPTVFDWNGDGLLDIITSGSIAHYKVYLNVGSATSPELAAPFDLYCDGYQLHGVWRVRPAVARIDGEVYILTQDDGNALHLYRRADDRTVLDCGRILLEDGSAITGHNGDLEPLGLGQWGRAKLRFYDWDGDGDLDLFLGCIKRASFPAPQTGLPYRRFKAKKVGMQVLYFENVGDATAAGMKFAQPRQVQIDGKDVPLGAHSNAPEPCLLGPVSDGAANLLVGCESGKFFFFERSHITFVD